MELRTILLLHNHYRSAAPSGESTAFRADLELLRSEGHDVIEYTRSNDELEEAGPLELLKAGLTVPWNRVSAERVRRLARVHRPDVVHVHNTFPLLSPSVFSAAHTLGICTVATLHNFRLFCAAGILSRNGNNCTLCLDKHSVIDALRYGCYRNSRLMTTPVALSIAYHRKIGTWSRVVDGYMALSAYQRDLLVNAGLPSDAVFVKPNTCLTPPDSSRGRTRAKCDLCWAAGPEKGVRVLVQAWAKLGDSAPHLDIIGAGTEQLGLVEMVSRLDLGRRIRILPQMPHADLQNAIRRSRLLVLPSTCPEGIPMVLVEAFSVGVPGLASRIGSIPSIIEDNKNGVLVTPGDAGALAESGRRLWADPARLQRMSNCARESFEANYSRRAAYRALLAGYKQAMKRHAAFHLTH